LAETVPLAAGAGAAGAVVGVGVDVDVDMVGGVWVGGGEWWVEVGLLVG
jgi:hypothetical protein